MLWTVGTYSYTYTNSGMFLLGFSLVLIFSKMMNTWAHMSWHIMVAISKWHRYLYTRAGTPTTTAQKNQFSGSHFSSLCGLLGFFRLKNCLQEIRFLCNVHCCLHHRLHHSAHFIGFKLATSMFVLSLLDVCHHIHIPQALRI